MLIVPIGTDAPIYHWPVVSLITIIINTAIYFFRFSFYHDGEIAERYWELQLLAELQFGAFKPWQWLTANYIHYDFFHLLGNMMGLWGIGIIVEGKIGWWKYMLLYNLIGIVSCAVLQTMLIMAPEGSAAGASLCIFGLMAIAMVWAPANEMTVLAIFWIGFIVRVITFEVTVYAFVVFFLFVEIVMGIIHMMFASTYMEEYGIVVLVCSATLHVAGAAAGFGLGVFMLRRGWVDCENWDLFSVWQDRHLMTREQLAEEKLNSEEGKRKLAQAREAMTGQFHNFMKLEEPAAALAVHRRGKLQFSDWRLAEPEHIQLIQALRKAQLWDDTVLTMVEYLHLYSERAGIVRLALAQLLIEQLGRPMQGLKVLSKLDPKQLPAPQQQKLAALRQRAQAETEENPFEATVDDW
jgi:membrane associated rhomboid family serine protease